MKNTNLRNRIADILKYLPKEERSYYNRNDVEIQLDELCTDNGVSLLELVEKYAVPIGQVFIRGYSSEDWDGYKEGGIALYTYRKQTDLEYFDYLADILCPTQYQIEQYRTYLSLKKQFESER